MPVESTAHDVPTEVIPKSLGHCRRLMKTAAHRLSYLIGLHSTEILKHPNVSVLVINRKPTQFTPAAALARKIERLRKFEWQHQ